MVNENGSAQHGVEDNGYHEGSFEAHNGETTNGHTEPGSDTPTECVSETDDNNMENTAESEVAGDAEYELNREELPSASAHEWKFILLKAEYAEELCEQIRKMKPYDRCQSSGSIVPTKSLRDLVEVILRDRYLSESG
ncbi:hypothetical protein NECAME_03069 [Necator americanus]|uniref:Uncharacterized protein n=1 Tax=Necator americanus TaxID=51031 RepID=W2T8W9_NECAM|nr:hypothetical protein NECAME_03069 [Necator americanus]ETN77651.1 hypothetical protein NECAME_03069 [Necator americanus]